MYFLIGAPCPDNIGKWIYVVMNGFWFVSLSVAAEGSFLKAGCKGHHKEDSLSILNDSPKQQINDMNKFGNYNNWH